MKKNNNGLSTHRRGFLGSIAAGAAALGMAALAPLKINAETLSDPHKETSDPDEWFNKVKGKHRIVFDATHPAGIFPFAWPRVFLLTNQGTGTPASDCGVVVILRHAAIG